ncbi:MAG: GNAT family N-acetyltransferase [Bacillota bacterium]
MDINHEDNRFLIKNENGEIIAYLSYSFEDDTTLIANSTFVDPVLRGQGIARKLLDRFAEYARKNGYKVRPLCSYVVDKFNSEDTYDDLKIES